MKRRLLLLACILCAFHATAQIEELTLPDGKEIKIDRSIYRDLQFDAPSKSLPEDIAVRRKARAKKGKTELPPFVYNGEKKYFPPIFNQDGGSCGSAQSVGYMFTYEMSCYRDLNASLPENQYPTHFTWLLAYQSSSTEAMAMKIGIPNVPTYGGRTYSRLFGPQGHDDIDYAWMQGYDRWYSAMWNKASKYINLGNTNTPEGRQILKEWLYNHCGDETLPAGGIVGIGVASAATTAPIPSTAANREAGVAGMKYVQAWGEAFDHALTVCGYDDRIEFDLDGDGKIGEVEEDEVGAWIIANSWGNGWANKGFVYCPYKYSYAIGKNTLSWNPGALHIRRNYRPLRTIKLLMEYSHRSEMLLCAGISENLNATKPDMTIMFEHFRNAGNTLGADPAPEVPMLGRWVDGMHYEPMEFGYDLTDLTATFDRTKPLKYFFIVKTDADAIGKGLIHKASIINYEIENKGVEIPFEQTNVEIQKGKNETIISVIVPGEQFYPPTDLFVQDKQLRWSEPQTSSLTLLGYHIYEEENLLAEVPAEQTQFTLNENAVGPFTVKAVYEAGEYGMESVASNRVMLEMPLHENNYLLRLDTCSLIIPNAIAQPLNEATIEFYMACSKNISYSHQIGPGWGSFLFHNDGSGNLSVGWENNRVDRLDVKNVITAGENRWYHIAIVIDGSTLTLYVNGVRKGQITSKTYSGLPALGDLSFGHTNASESWMGGLEEIRIWKKARTQTEIMFNMRMPIARPALQPDLLIYLPMDTIEVDGKTLLHEWASGKHASLQIIGTGNVSEERGPITTQSDKMSLTIIEEDTTHVKDIPFKLLAESSLNATNWTWTVSDTQIPVKYGINPTFTFSEAGTYSISCTAEFTSGETLTETKEVIINEGEAPIAAFDILKKDLPAGDRFSFINRSIGEGCTYLWSMPGAEVEEIGGTNATALYPQIGTFPVTLTVSNSSGSSSITHEVTVHESAPDAYFDISKTSIMLGDTIQLIDKSRYNPLSWKWELFNNARYFWTEEQSPYIVPKAPGIYNITLQVANDLGENTITQNNYLVVSNDNPGTSLHFNGTERLQLSCPFDQAQKMLTLEWWMQPQQEEGSINLSATEGNLTTSVDDKGMLTITLGSQKATSEEGFVISNEWHHYAIVYRYGTVKFYRDAILISTSPTKIGLQIPVLGTISMGTESGGFRGKIDEVRLWAAAFDEEKIAAYCNQHIDNVLDAETNENLLLYYDFNQSGGDVIDRTTSACHAQRIGFGPDGDAWGDALGVFTLDIQAPTYGDISANYLTNYKNPFRTLGSTVNPNNSNRFRRLAMGTTYSTWKDANAIVKNDITTGAHIDMDHHGDITFETQWSGFATPLLNYHLWQTITLPAGKYKFSVTFSDGNDAQKSRLVVCKGKDMINDDECEQKAIAWSNLVDGNLSFTLTEETEISLGIIVNLEGQASFGISAFKLEGFSCENLEPIIPTSILLPSEKEDVKPILRGIYNLSGKRLDTPQKGINIVNGKKILNK